MTCVDNITIDHLSFDDGALASIPAFSIARNSESKKSFSGNPRGEAGPSQLESDSMSASDEGTWLQIELLICKLSFVNLTWNSLSENESFLALRRVLKVTDKQGLFTEKFDQNGGDKASVEP